MHRLFYIIMHNYACYYSDIIIKFFIRDTIIRTKENKIWEGEKDVAEAVSDRERILFD